MFPIQTFNQKTLEAMRVHLALRVIVSPGGFIRPILNPEDDKITINKLLLIITGVPSKARDAVQKSVL